MSRHGERKKEPFVVGICGGTASGKSELSASIVSEWRDSITYLQLDRYYCDLSHLSADVRAATNFDHLDALDTDLLAKHLHELKSGREVMVPGYDFTTHTRCPGEVMSSNKVILLEGILIFAEEKLLELMDAKIFIDEEEGVRLRRRVERDVKERGRTREEVMSQYEDTVRPMHDMFVEPSKGKADLILNSSRNTVALGVIKELLRREIQDREV